MNRFTHYFLIGVLIGCPLWCQVGDAPRCRRRGWRRRADVGCSCCVLCRSPGRIPEPASSPTPPLPADVPAEKGCQCICGGAILPDRASQSRLEAAKAPVRLHVAACPLVLLLADGQFFLLPDLLPARAVSGRSRCIWHRFLRC